MLSYSDIHLTSYVFCNSKEKCLLPSKCSNKKLFFKIFENHFNLCLIQNKTAIKLNLRKSSNNHKMVSFPQSVVASRTVVIPQEEWGPEQQMCPGPGQPHLTDVPVSKQMILLGGSSIDQSRIQKQDVRGKKS